MTDVEGSSSGSGSGSGEDKEEVPIRTKKREPGKIAKAIKLGVVGDGTVGKTTYVSKCISALFWSYCFVALNYQILSFVCVTNHSFLYDFLSIHCIYCLSSDF
jgi:hypothetical protein